MTWLDASGGYQVRLTGDGKVGCRNSKGKELTSVPAALKNDEQVAQLRLLAEWLERHASECLLTVDRWMVRSLPVPTPVVTEVWPDPSWRDALRDLVVTAGDETGFLRDADPDRGAGIVTADGDIRWLRPEILAIPHPVLLGDLEDLREFGAELGIDQKVQQLFRQTFVRPENASGDRVTDFSGGRFAELNHATTRCRQLGYPVRGGYATNVTYEKGDQVEARFWVGADYPDAATYTADLSWSRPDGSRLPVAAVGPVAWSEGMRMASTIYAGRQVEESAA